MDFDQILAALGQASDDDLASALTELNRLQTEGRDLPVTEDNVAALERYASAASNINGELARRTELTSRRDAALAAVGDGSGGTGTDGTTDGMEGTGEGAGHNSDDGGQGGAVEGDETNTGGSAVDEPADGEANEGDDAVTASGKAKLGTVRKQGANAQPNRPVITASTAVQAEVRGHTPGNALNETALVDAMLEQFRHTNQVFGQGNHPVSRTTFNYPDTHSLGSDGTLNRQRISAAKANLTQDSLVAAGGLCAPLETRYDINVLGVTARPIRDALVRFGVDRGGIQYRPPMDALTMTDGLGIWTMANDAAVGEVEDPDVPDPQKTCAIVDCPDVVNAVVYAIYLCLQFSNVTARFDPEFVSSTIRRSLIAHARFAENRLLSQILAGSKLLTSAQKVSATRDVLVALDQSVAYYRNRHRLDAMVPLRMIMPRWVLELFRADLTRGFSGDLDALAVADATIMTWFRARGVNVTWHLDGLDAATVGAVTIPQQFYSNAAAGTAIPGFPNSIDAALYAEGDWLYLDGGTLDLGLVRDSTLDRINRYQTFTESWEGVAFDGIESLRLKIDVNPTGAVVGTLDPATTAFTD